jgi:hypothetical protein
MSIVHTHLTEIRVRLTTSPVIRTFSVIEERSGLDYGCTQQTLRKRWDNANHHSELPNFPHHVHEGDEANVAPGVMLQIVDLIVLLEQALGG